jgi:hypothetical protein
MLHRTVAYCLLTFALATATGCWISQDLGPLHQDGGSDSDSDGDSDGDTDADSDSDTDTGTFTCEELPAYCCSPDCPCEDDAYVCVPTHWSGEDGAGVCHISAPAGECWTTAECGDHEFCAGAFVCGCWMDCEWEGTGVCSPVTMGCCESQEDCDTNYFCMELSASSTCHGQLEFPACWEDDDCGTGSCVDPQICSCLENCLSVPGHCDNWD